MPAPVLPGEPSLVVRPSILVVDDEPRNIRVIEAALSGVNADVLSAVSGIGALELAEGRRIAVAVLDVCMPEMDGFDLALRLQSSQEYRVPIIFLTALDRNDEASMVRAYSTGSADFLYKPLDPIMLRAKVEVFIDLFLLHESEALKSHHLKRLKGELELRNQELTLRNCELDSFTHVISHDLRQPLGSILNYLELIEESGAVSDPDSARWIKSCVSLGGSMQSLIEKTLDFVRLSGKAPEMSDTDANAALAKALANLGALVRESGARIISDALPTITGSESLLTSLFQNIIGNAIHYRGTEPPHIEVRCQQQAEDGAWRFRISDNGRGFDNAAAERIFEMFGRCDEAASVPGTGIGLAFCKRIVEAHGGRIWAESCRGQGAQFYFVLPCAGSALLPPSEEGYRNGGD